jgi:hypothetical protein
MTSIVEILLVCLVADSLTLGARALAMLRVAQRASDFERRL